MNQRKTVSTKAAKQQTSQPQKRSRFSRAMMQLARKNLKEFEKQSDEAFLIRAEMDRKLSCL